MNYVGGVDKNMDKRDRLDFLLRMDLFEKEEAAMKKYEE